MTRRADPRTRHAPRPVHPRHAHPVALLREIAAGVRPESLRTQLPVMAEADQRDLLPRIAVPTLLIWGELDARSPLSVARQIRQAITDAELVVIPGCGHASNLAPSGSTTPCASSAAPTRPDRRAAPGWRELPTQARCSATAKNYSGAVDDDAIRSMLARLGRPHPSGGTVVERAAIVAEGADFDAVMAWIVAHGGQPEAAVQSPARHGLHGSSLYAGGGAEPRAPSRFVLPAGALD